MSGPSQRRPPKKKKPALITSKQIKNGTIQSKDLAKSVQTKINAGAKALKVIANGSVGTAQLADNSISSAKIAALAVTTAKLAEGAVTTGKLAENAVDSARVAPDSLRAEDLAPNAVGTPELANGAVTADKVGPNGVATIDLPNIVAGNCTTDDSIATGKELAGDNLLVTADGALEAGLTLRASPIAGQSIRLSVCNVTANPINPGDVAFSWVVLEN